MCVHPDIYLLYHHSKPAFLAVFEIQILIITYIRDALKKPYLRTLSQLGLTPPLPSHFGTSTIGTFELGFGPPPTYKNLGHIDKNFG